MCRKTGSTAYKSICINYEDRSVGSAPGSNEKKEKKREKKRGGGILVQCTQHVFPLPPKRALQKDCLTVTDFAIVWNWNEIASVPLRPRYYVVRWAWQLRDTVHHQHCFTFDPWPRFSRENIRFQKPGAELKLHWPLFLTVTEWFEK